MKPEFAPSGVPAGLYGLFARAFDYPDEAFWDRVEGQPLGDTLGAVSADCLPVEMTAGIIGRRSQGEREADYFAAFERGVPAYEGLCRAEEGRDGILEELLRFYHYFGLRLNAQRRDFPDSFVTEMEFMNYLVELEWIAAARGDDVSSLQRAQRDFLGRHVAVWTERLQCRFVERGIDNAYARLARWLNVMAQAHLDRLERLLAEGAGPASSNNRPDQIPSLFQSHGGQP
jgi:DMSO reductase family type II enzyme chaperone